MTGIQMALLGIGQGDTVDVQGGFSSVNVVDPDDATAGYRITSAGIEQDTGASGTYSGTHEVVDPVSNLANYEVRMTVNSGSFDSGTVGSWLSLGTTRTWSISQTDIGSKSANGTIEIRRIGTTTVLDSDTVALTAEVTDLS